MGDLRERVTGPHAGTFSSSETNFYFAYQEGTNRTMTHVLPSVGILRDEPLDVRRNAKAITFTSSTVVIISVLTAVAGPIAVYLAGSSVNDLSFQIFAFPWQIVDNELMLLEPFRMTIFFPLIIPRLIFAYMLQRYYEGNTTRARTLLMGLLSELQIIVLSILVIYLRGLFPLGSYIQVALPIPLLLVLGLILLMIHEEQEPTEPWEGIEPL
jgi:hypothetical protein